MNMLAYSGTQPINSAIYLKIQDFPKSGINGWIWGPIDKAGDLVYYGIFMDNILVSLSVQNELGYSNPVSFVFAL